MMKEMHRGRRPVAIPRQVPRHPGPRPVARAVARAAAAAAAAATLPIGLDVANEGCELVEDEVRGQEGREGDADQDEGVVETPRGRGHRERVIDA